MSQATGAESRQQLSAGRTVSRLLLVAAVILLSGMLLRNLLMRYSRAGGIDLGTQMPAITADGWLNGEPLTAASLRGKVVVVDFWATWCGPCRRATPEIVQTYQKFKERGVVFVGLTAEPADAIPDIESFVQEFQVPWVIGYGAGQTFERFETEGIPRVWVVDRNGKIKWDSYSPGTLEAALEEVL